MERLHRLFGIVVSFPWLRPGLPFLLRLPLKGPGLCPSVYGVSMASPCVSAWKTRKTKAELLFFIKKLLQSLASFLEETAHANLNLSRVPPVLRRLPRVIFSELCRRGSSYCSGMRIPPAAIFSLVLTGSLLIFYMIEAEASRWTMNKNVEKLVQELNEISTRSHP